jgi:Chloramphenicol phosphotransferase-like protein
VLISDALIWMIWSPRGRHRRWLRGRYSERGRLEEAQGGSVGQVASVIVLTGPSCAGKTSLARALQSLLPFPAVHIEADRMFPVLPLAHPRWDAEARHAAAVLAMHRSIAAWAAGGFDLIADGSLPYGMPRPALGLPERARAIRDAPGRRAVRTGGPGRAGAGTSWPPAGLGRPPVAGHPSGPSARRGGGYLLSCAWRLRRARYLPAPGAPGLAGSHRPGSLARPPASALILSLGQMARCLAAIPAVLGEERIVAVFRYRHACEIGLICVFARACRAPAAASPAGEGAR